MQVLTLSLDLAHTLAILQDGTGFFRPLEWGQERLYRSNTAEMRRSYARLEMLAFKDAERAVSCYHQSGVRDSDDDRRTISTH